MKHKVLKVVKFTQMYWNLESQYGYRPYVMVFKYFSDMDPQYGWVDFDMVLQDEGAYEDEY